MIVKKLNERALIKQVEWEPRVSPSRWGIKRTRKGAWLMLGTRMLIVWWK